VPEPVRVFLSTVSNEFGDYRDQLRSKLTRHNVEVKIQEDFKDLGGVTLDKLDVYIKACDAVVHLVGDMTGADRESCRPRRSSKNTLIWPENSLRLVRTWPRVSVSPIRSGRPGSRSTMAKRC
jgi:Domain of unknown function (DUF4062)